MAEQKEQVPFLIRRGQLKAVTGLSPSSVDRLEQSGVFPARRHVVQCNPT